MQQASAVARARALRRWLQRLARRRRCTLPPATAPCAICALFAGGADAAADRAQPRCTAARWRASSSPLAHDSLADVAHLRLRTIAAPRPRSSSVASVPPSSLATAFLVTTGGVRIMSRACLAPGAFALALSLHSAAHAATDADLARNPRADPATEGKLRSAHPGARAAAEGRRSEARPRAPHRPPHRRAAAVAGRAATAPPRRRRPSGISAFNPAISAVLQGVYANLSQDPNHYAIAGFAPSGDIAPAQARLQHRRVGARALRQRRRQVLRQPDLLARAREHGRGRGSLRHLHRAARTASRRSSAASSPASAT